MFPNTPLKRRIDASEEYRFYSRPRLFDIPSIEMMDEDSPAVIETLTSNSDESDVDVVFSFDTTGSMRSVIDNVRQNLKETVCKLFEEIPGIRIGIIAHGDYCDYPKMMWKINPTKDVQAVETFIKESKNTSGGDAPECYEYVLHVANQIEWKSSVKVLVIIGDESPHEKGYFLPRKIPGFQSQLTIDWKEEAAKLKEKGVTIFSCHALPEQNKQSIPFYTTISTVTNGMYLKLDEFKDFQYYMVSICMKASDDAEALALIKQRQEELEKMLQDLTIGDEERKSLKMEFTETSSAIQDAEMGEIMTSSAFASAKKNVRKTPSKANAYIRSMRTNAITSPSTQSMFDQLYDE